MFLLVLLVASVSISGIQTNPDVKPYALIDDARAELETLKNSMLRAIASAGVKLDNYYEKFVSESNTAKVEAEHIIMYEEHKLYGQVTAVEELAQGAGADISGCLGAHEEDAQNFKSRLIEEVGGCISVEIKEAENIVEEYRYLTDTAINRIYTIEYQLGLCDEDNEDCIAPLYERIQYERKYATEHIEMQLIKVNNFLRQLKATVQECSNLNVNLYISIVNALLQDVTECAAAIFPLK